MLYVTSSNKDKNQDLVQQIRKWAVQYNVSHGCANEMLNILRNIAYRSRNSQGYPYNST